MISGRNSPGGWRVTTYPQVGEGSAVYVSGRGGRGESPTTPDSAAELSERAARRAGTMIRRYLVANRLRYMWVLTFADPVYDHAAAAEQVAGLAAVLRAVFPQVGPYLYCGEPHPQGHGWHVNLFVGVRLPHAQVEELWGRGFVFVSDWVRRKGATGSLRERVRKAARYAAKYAAKSLTELAEYGCRRDEGEHRYEKAQGFDARRDQHTAVSIADMRDILALVVPDEGYQERWLSDDPGWRGPPVLWFAWSV